MNDEYVRRGGEELVEMLPMMRATETVRDNFCTERGKRKDEGRTSIWEAEEEG